MSARRGVPSPSRGAEGRLGGGDHPRSREIRCLFDVASDPSEHADLSDALPALRAELASLLADRNRGNFAPRRGVSSLRACAEGVRNGGSSP